MKNLIDTNDILTVRDKSVRKAAIDLQGRVVKARNERKRTIGDK